MKRLLVLAGLLLTAVVFVGCAQPTASAPSASAPSTTVSTPAASPAQMSTTRSVFVVGDSNSTGFRGTFAEGSFSGDAWAARLPADRFAPIDGWAVDGAVSGAMRAGVEALTPRADQLIVMAGTNDLANGVAPDTVVENVAAIVGLVPGADVLILAIAPFDALAVQATELNATFSREAAERGWDYLDPWAAARAPDGTWMPSMTIDGVHATRDGYAAAGDVVADHLTAGR